VFVCMLGGDDGRRYSSLWRPPTTPIVIPKDRRFQHAKRLPRDRCRRMLCRHGLSFEIDHHLGPGHLGAGIERIHVGYDKIRSLCLCSALLAISNEFGKSVDWLLTGEKEK
jgi:hypothetical protein